MRRLMQEGGSHLVLYDATHEVRHDGLSRDVREGALQDLRPLGASGCARAPRRGQQGSMQAPAPARRGWNGSAVAAWEAAPERLTAGAAGRGSAGPRRVMARGERS
jgi:hypothetical protein